MWAELPGAAQGTNGTPHALRVAPLHEPQATGLEEGTEVNPPSSIGGRVFLGCQT